MIVECCQATSIPWSPRAKSHKQHCFDWILDPRIQYVPSMTSKSLLLFRLMLSNQTLSVSLSSKRHSGWSVCWDRDRCSIYHLDAGTLWNHWTLVSLLAFGGCDTTWPHELLVCIDTCILKHNRVNISVIIHSNLKLMWVGQFGCWWWS